MGVDTTADEFSKTVMTMDVNEGANGAVLHFGDGSYLQFVHTSRSNRWAKASSEEGFAAQCCEALDKFRLNGKHLQLYFEDGSDTDMEIEENQE
jgi:hypothetical protein